MIETLVLIKYISIPLISALIGWFTNVIAIKMLFYPRKPFLFFQGIIPKKKAEMADRIADIVSKELVNYDTITKKMSGGGNNAISKSISKLIDVPIFGDIIGEVASEYLHELGSNSELSGKTDDFIRNMVKEKIENFDLDKLEQMVYKVADKEFKIIERLGFWLGGIIGVVQVLIMIML